MGLLSIFKSPQLGQMNSDSIWHMFMACGMIMFFGFRWGIPLWACGMIMLYSVLKYITLMVVKNMTVFMSLILILRRFTEKYDRFYVIDFNFAKVY